MTLSSLFTCSRQRSTTIATNGAVVLLQQKLEEMKFHVSRSSFLRLYIEDKYIGVIQPHNFCLVTRTKSIIVPIMSNMLDKYLPRSFNPFRKEVNFLNKAFRLISESGVSSRQIIWFISYSFHHRICEKFKIPQQLYKLIGCKKRTFHTLALDTSSTSYVLVM